MAKRTKKNSKSARSLLKLEALEQRQLLAGGFTDAQGQQWQDIVHSNGNVYDQVLLKSSSITVNADPGQVTRVSFLDQQGDIVQAEFAGSGTLTISLDPDTFQSGVDPVNYLQSGIKYVQGVATFTIQGSAADTNFSVFSVGKGNAANPNLFDLTHTGGDNTADVARLTIVANPENPSGSVFGGIRAANAIFSADSGVVGIAAANVHVQDVVRIGDIDAKGSASPTLVFGANSQFGSVDVAGGNMLQTNGKAINNNGSYDFDLTLVAGTNSAGTALPAADTYSQLTFTDKNPIENQTAKTFSLSSVTDAGTAFVGTPGDDTYVAAVGSDGIPSSGTTLNAGDILNGGGGTDSLSVSISGTNTAAQTTASFTANNIEVLSIGNFETSANGSTLDLALVPQLTTVKITSSSANGDTELSSVQALVAATMANGTGDLTIGYAGSVVSGTADAQSLTLSAQTAGTFTAAGIETLNIASNTAANTVGLAGAAMKTVNVTGDQNLTISGNLPAAVTKVDASALTGKLSVTGNDAVNYNLIGGTANDSFAITTGFTNADTVNGGDGSDTLSVNVAVTEDTIKNVSNVETLKVTGANTLTFNKDVGPTTFDLSEGGDQVLTLTTSLTTAYAQATTVVLTGDNAANADKVVNSANVALTINANTEDIDATTTITGGTGTDTMNLVAKTAANADLTAVTGVESIVVTGSAAGGVAVADATVASGKTLTIDASAATGNLTITSADTNGKLSITTGSGKDTITAGSGGSDTIISGAGNDSISLGEVKATHVITAGDGNDTLTVSATDIADAGKLAGVTGVETLALGAGVDLTLAAPVTATGIATIDISDDGDNVLTLKTGYTGALAITMTGDDTNADKIVNSANVDLTIAGNVADIDAATTITGGSGSDVLNLQADAGTATITNLSGVESITIGLDSVTPTNGATVLMGANNTQIAAGKTLVVNASALTDSGAVFTFTGDNNETDGFLSVTGGAGNDVLTGANSGFDTLIGGAGNDSITLTTLAATNIIGGGDGSDTLSVTTDIATSSAFLGVTGIETLKLGASTDLTLTSNIKSSTGIATINAADASDNIITISAGVTDAVTVVLTGDDTNADKIVNSGNVALTVTAGVADIDAATTITGGTGTDVINLKAVANADAANLSAVTGVETVTIAKSGFTSTITVGADAVVAAGKTLTIDGSAADAALTIDGSAETNGTLVLKGGSGADTIVGGGAADSFSGGNGADVFTMVAHTNKLTFDTVTDLASNDVVGTVNQGTEVWNSTKITLGGLATFSDYLDAASTGDGSTNGIFRWFQFGGNTYIVEDVSAGATFVSNADRVIEIQGTKDISGSALVGGGNGLTISIA